MPKPGVMRACSSGAGASSAGRLSSGLPEELQQTASVYSLEVGQLSEALAPPRSPDGEVRLRSTHSTQIGDPSRIRDVHVSCFATLRIGRCPKSTLSTVSLVSPNFFISSVWHFRMHTPESIDTGTVDAETNLVSFGDAEPGNALAIRSLAQRGCGLGRELGRGKGAKGCMRQGRAEVTAWGSPEDSGGPLSLTHTVTHLPPGSHSLLCLKARMHRLRFQRLGCSTSSVVFCAAVQRERLLNNVSCALLAWVDLVLDRTY